MDGNEHGKAMAEVREWLTRIDQKQEHIVQLLEDSRAKAEEAYKKADQADETSKEALKLTETHIKEYRHDRTQSDDNRKFWIKVAVPSGVGLLTVFVTIMIFLLPMLVQYHTP